MRTASCQCGHLSLTVEGDPTLVSACKCTRCQKRSGSAFALSSRWNANQVRQRSGNGLTYSRKGTSGGNVQFEFCPICGSTVTTILDILPDVIGIPVGCFADPTFLSPRSQPVRVKAEWVLRWAPLLRPEPTNGDTVSVVRRSHRLPWLPQDKGRDVMLYAGQYASVNKYIDRTTYIVYEYIDVSY